MTEFVLRLIAWGGYWGIFLLMTLENVVPPVPSELIMGLGGIAVARGHMEFVPLVIAGTAGTVLGNMFWYVIGRRLGYAGLKPIVDRWGRWLTLDWEEVEKLNRFFARHGGWVVFVFRFMPSFRTIISLPAGMLGMPFWKFLVWTAGGSAIWNVFLAAGGVLLGTRFQQLERFIGPLAIATMVFFVGWYVWRVFTWKPNK
jgi:membrane protein DedA with SNARE-associated domain